MMSHKYNVKDLFQVCDENLAETIEINETNIENWIIFADRYGTKKIAKSLLNFKLGNESLDNQWEDWAEKYPDFAKLICIMAGNKNYLNRYKIKKMINFYVFPIH